MPNKLKRILKGALHASGIDLRRHDPNAPHDLSRLLKLYRVETVFDIGANIGMSGQYFRNLGFTGQIISFEPIRDLYEKLTRTSANDPQWTCENTAIGDADGKQQIFVTGGGGAASSFLSSIGHMEEAAPELAVVGQETVTVRTLRSVIQERYPIGDRLFLKIDAQGYEKKILESAGPDLKRVVGIRIELSFVRSYADEPLFCEMLPYLYDLGFRMCAIEEAWSHRKTQEVYQVDAVMFRPELIELI